QEFKLSLPDLAVDDVWKPSSYFADVTQAVQGLPRWEVLPNDIVLWFFSFAKYLMYRDLDPEVWPTDRPLPAHPLVSSLLGGGFLNEPALCGKNDNIDPLLPPAEMVHVVDADSSQAVVIEEIRRGRNLVI